MAHSTEQVKADAASIALGRCPETGRDLSKLSVSAIRGHAHELFPHGDDSDKVRTDYGRRYRLVMNYADQVEKTARGAQS